LCITEDGKFLVTGSEDTTVLVWAMILSMENERDSGGKGEGERGGREGEEITEKNGERGTRKETRGGPEGDQRETGMKKTVDLFVLIFFQARSG
jgi:hypothetical protein